jgi:sialidase-1
MASIVRFSEKGENGGGGTSDRSRIVFAHPHNPGGRERRNLTVKLSYDEAVTWPVARTLEPGLAGYSDLAVGPDGTIYCFYERGGLEGSAFKTKFLTVARFNLEWLTDGKDAAETRRP